MSHRSNDHCCCCFCCCCCGSCCCRSWRRGSPTFTWGCSVSGRRWVSRPTAGTPRRPRLSWTPRSGCRLPSRRWRSLGTRSQRRWRASRSPSSPRCASRTPTGSASRANGWWRGCSGLQASGCRTSRPGGPTTPRRPPSSNACCTPCLRPQGRMDARRSSASPLVSPPTAPSTPSHLWQVRASWTSHAHSRARSGRSSPMPHGEARLSVAVDWGRHGWSQSRAVPGWGLSRPVPLINRYGIVLRVIDSQIFFPTESLVPLISKKSAFNCSTRFRSTGLSFSNEIFLFIFAKGRPEVGGGRIASTNRVGALPAAADD